MGRIFLHDKELYTTPEKVNELRKNPEIPPKSAPEFRGKDYQPDNFSVGQQWTKTQWEERLRLDAQKVNYYLHCDQERAIYQGAELGLLGVNVAHCGRHLASGTQRYLFPLISEKNRFYVLFKLFYGPKAAVTLKCEKTAGRIIDKCLTTLQSEKNKENYEKAKRYIDETMRPFLLKLVRYAAERRDFYDAPTHYTSNASESYNAKIKSHLRHRAVPVDMLINELWTMSHSEYEDIPRALADLGQFKITDAGKQHLKGYMDKDSKEFEITNYDDKKLRTILKRMHTLPKKSRNELESAWKTTIQRRRNKFEKEGLNELEESSGEQSDDEENPENEDQSFGEGLQGDAERICRQMALMARMEAEEDLEEEQEDEQEEEREEVSMEQGGSNDEDKEQETDSGSESQARVDEIYRNLKEADKKKKLLEKEKIGQKKVKMVKSQGLKTPSQKTKKKIGQTQGVEGHRTRSLSRTRKPKEKDD